MRLKLLSATSLILFSSISFAKPAPPLENIEVYGQVTLNGQAAADVPVEFRTGSCFAEVNGKTKTNKNGFYYIKLAQFFRAGGDLHVIVPTDKTAKSSYAPYCTYESVPIEYKSNQKIRYNLTLSKAVPISTAEKQCLAQGWQWGPLTKDKIGCNLIYKDASQMCTDGSQCSSKTCIPARRYIGGFCASSTYQIMNAAIIMQAGKKIEKKTD